MGTAERRRREKQEMRHLILDAARELFVSEGYEAVTMRKIAERIEYSPTAIYAYFADKASLVRELCEQDFLSLAQSFARIMAIADPIARLKACGAAYVQFALDFPQQYQFMFVTVLPADIQADVKAESTHKGNPREDAYCFLRMSIEQALAEGRFKPEIKDPDLVAQMVWGAVHGVVMLHLVRARDQWVEWKPVTETAKLTIDTLMRGLLRSWVTDQ